jgi:hypothetical protein
MGNEPKPTKNAGVPWSDTDVQELRDLVEGNTPTLLIGLKLGRTEDAVRDRARELKLSLARRTGPRSAT